MQGNIHSLYISANNYSPPLPLIHRPTAVPFPTGEGKKGILHYYNYYSEYRS